MYSDLTITQSWKYIDFRQWQGFKNLFLQNIFSYIVWNRVNLNIFFYDPTELVIKFPSSWVILRSKSDLNFP